MTYILSICSKFSSLTYSITFFSKYFAVELDLKFIDTHIHNTYHIFQRLRCFKGKIYITYRFIVFQTLNYFHFNGNLDDIKESLIKNLNFFTSNFTCAKRFNPFDLLMLHSIIQYIKRLNFTHENMIAKLNAHLFEKNQFVSHSHSLFFVKCFSIIVDNNKWNNKQTSWASSGKVIRIAL